ncbi:MAG: hypothetical protein QG552_1433 [Thermodesulfobacteriota bacterium]|nr:hypothetical protein [Thermodesulfobacteriota bacterium]
MDLNRMDELFPGKVWTAIGAVALTGLFVISQYSQEVVMKLSGSGDKT